MGVGIRSRKLSQAAERKGERRGGGRQLVRLRQKVARVRVCMRRRRDGQQRDEEKSWSRFGGKSTGRESIEYSNLNKYWCLVLCFTRGE